MAHFHGVPIDNSLVGLTAALTLLIILAYILIAAGFLVRWYGDRPTFSPPALMAIFLLCGAAGYASPLAHVYGWNVPPVVIVGLHLADAALAYGYGILQLLDTAWPGLFSDEEPVGAVV